VKSDPTHPMGLSFACLPRVTSHRTSLRGFGGANPHRGGPWPRKAWCLAHVCAGPRPRDRPRAASRPSRAFQCDVPVHRHGSSCFEARTPLHAERKGQGSFFSPSVVGFGWTPSGPRSSPIDIFFLSPSISHPRSRTSEDEGLERIGGGGGSPAARIHRDLLVPIAIFDRYLDPSKAGWGSAGNLQSRRTWTRSERIAHLRARPDGTCAGFRPCFDFTRTTNLAWKDVDAKKRRKKRIPMLPRAQHEHEHAIRRTWRRAKCALACGRRASERRKGMSRREETCSVRS